jgi:hypothetical protein
VREARYPKGGAHVRLFIKLVFEVGDNGIIDSFWDSNHGKQSMVLLFCGEPFVILSNLFSELFVWRE